MKIFSIILAILTINKILAEDLCNEILSISGKYTLLISPLIEEAKEGATPLPSDEGSQSLNANLLSYGATDFYDDKYRSILNEGSELLLDKKKYVAKSCEEESLLTESSDGQKQYFKIAKIIQKPVVSDPINQIKYLSSICKDLTNVGNYDLTLQDDDGKTFKARFEVSEITSIDYHYSDYNTFVNYTHAVLIDDKGYSRTINSCKDYYYNSRLRTEKKLGGSLEQSYKIIKIDKKVNVSSYSQYLCGTLSVPGSYSLKLRGKEVGILDVLDKPYQSLYHPNYSKKYTHNFVLQYSHKNLPNLTNSLHKDLITLCVSSYDNTSFLKNTSKDLSASESDMIKFDQVDVISQNYEYFVKNKELLHNRLERKYNISNPIDITDINRLLDELRVLDRSVFNPQYCRDLIFPGRYIVQGFGHKQIEFINLAPTVIESIYNKDKISDSHVFYGFKVIPIHEGKKSDMQIYRCKDQFGSSNLYKYESNGENKHIIKIRSFSRTSLDLSKSSWVNDTLFKIKLRFNNLCAKLDELKSYELETLNFKTQLNIGSIKVRDFVFYTGYRVKFQNNFKNPEYVNSELVSHPLLKIEFQDQPLFSCFATENGNLLYVEKFNQLKDRFGYRKKASYSRDTELKFINLKEHS